MKLGLGTNFVISLGHVPKKADITEICFFSFCKMTSMTFQKSTVDLKSLNICRHIDLLPEFKVCILMEVEFLKSVHCRQHIISWQSWKLKLLSTTSLSSAPSLPWQTEKMRKSFVKKIFQTKVQNLNFLSALISKRKGI